MKKEYFAIFRLPAPSHEHAKITDVIRDVSNGDFKQIAVPGGIAYVFASETKPWNISFSRVLMNTDSVMIFEIGQETEFSGFGAVKGWIDSHRPRR